MKDYNKNIFNPIGKSPEFYNGIDRFRTHQDKNGNFKIKMMKNENKDKFKEQKMLKLIDENTLVTSDLHLYKKDTSSNQFVNVIINEIRKKSNNHDVLIILGDVMYKNDPEMKYHLKNFMQQLPISLKKILVLGNHDTLNISEYYEVGFDFVTDRINYNNWVFTHIPVEISSNKINFHGHIHEDKEYWNCSPLRHINVYIRSHNNCIYSIKEYLDFYKKGRYSGGKRINVKNGKKV